MEQSLAERFKSPDAYVSLILGLAVVFALGIFIYRLFTGPNSLTTAPKSAAEVSQTTPTGGKTHTVVAGDTLWTIAEKYYQDGFKWPEIQKANQLADATLEVGKQLNIPQVKLSPAPTGQILATSTETPATTAASKSYTVIRGDTLWAIAVKQYNNGYRWVDIARTNNLSNPDIIHPGNILTLP